MKNKRNSASDVGEVAVPTYDRVALESLRADFDKRLASLRADGAGDRLRDAFDQGVRTVNEVDVTSPES